MSSHLKLISLWSQISMVFRHQRNPPRNTIGCTLHYVSICLCNVCVYVCEIVCTGVDTCAISLHDNCQCVHLGWFIGREFGGLPRKESSPSSWKWANADLKRTAFQYANFLCLFIWFLMTSGSSQQSNFFPSLEEKKSHFSCWSFVTGTSKSSTWVTLNGKFARHLRWMPLKVYPLIPISAYVIPASSNEWTHTFPLPLLTHLLLIFALCSALPPL